MDRPPTPEHMERINRLVDALYAPGVRRVRDMTLQFNEDGYIKDNIFRRFFFPIIASYTSDTSATFDKVYDDVLLYEFHSAKARVKRRENGISKQDFIDYLKDRATRKNYSRKPFVFDEFMDQLDELIGLPPFPKLITIHIIQHGGPARFDMQVLPTTTIEDIKQFIKSQLEPTHKDTTIIHHALRIIYLGEEIENNKLTIYQLHIKNNSTFYFVFKLREKGLGGKKSRKCKKSKKSRKSKRI
jgi:hypothetical protein